jgi:hypothetical protein
MSLEVLVHHECHEMRETRLTGVPVTTQLVGDLLDAASTLADLMGQPATGSVGDEVSGKGDAGVDLAQGRGSRTGACGTRFSLLARSWEGPRGTLGVGPSPGRPRRTRDSPPLLACSRNEW